MKTLLLFGAIALSLNSFSQVPTYVPTNGLVGWWGFNGNANDESVNGNDGVVNGAILANDRFGNPNSAYAYDGFDDWIEVNHSASLNINQEISICANINAASLPSGTNYNIIEKGSTNNGWEYVLQIKDDGTINWRLVNPSGTGIYCEVNSSIAITLGQDYFITGTISDGNSIKLYINGVLDAQSVSFDPINQYAVGTSKLIFGARRGWVSHPDPTFLYDGVIDDIGIWNRVLTQCEIQDLYNAQLNSNVFTATQSGATLTADQAGATYQWLDCDDNNAQINGETNQSYTPTVTGNYSVEVTLNGCVDTSACFLVDYTGIYEINNSAIRVYPNPTKGSFSIEVDANIVGSNYVIYDQLGKVVQNGIINSPSQILNVQELLKGIYNLTIDNSDIRVRLIKK